MMIILSLSHTLVFALVLAFFWSIIESWKHVSCTLFFVFECFHSFHVCGCVGPISPRACSLECGLWVSQQVGQAREWWKAVSSHACQHWQSAQWFPTTITSTTHNWQGKCCCGVWPQCLRPDVPHAMSFGVAGAFYMGEIFLALCERKDEQCARSRNSTICWQASLSTPCHRLPVGRSLPSQWATVCQRHDPVL